MGCRLCQNPNFHEDTILAGYLEKRMWTLILLNVLGIYKTTWTFTE